MSDLHALVLRALGIRVIEDRLADIKRRNRRDLTDAMEVGDRKAATLPAGFVGPDATEPLQVGKVVYTKGHTSARIVDEAALLAWVKENHPTEIVTVETVRSSYLSAVLAAAKQEGVAVDPKTGETIPGAETYNTEPFLTVTPVSSPEVEDRMWAALLADDGKVVRSLLTDGQQP